VSIEAISWALNLALVPAQRGGQPPVFAPANLASSCGVQPAFSAASTAGVSLDRWAAVSGQAAPSAPKNSPARPAADGPACCGQRPAPARGGGGRFYLHALDGVRNPYAVLAVRLSAAELPPPPGWRPPRPPWCGECDKRTRMAGFYSDAPKPRPRCKPTARAQQHSPSPDGPHHLHGGPAQQASIGARAAQHRAHPVHRNDASGAFDPDPDPVCARRQ
jgi:hypothetical protein